MMRIKGRSGTTPASQRPLCTPHDPESPAPPRPRLPEEDCEYVCTSSPFSPSNPYFIHSPSSSFSLTKQRTSTLGSVTQQNGYTWGSTPAYKITKAALKHADGAVLAPIREGGFGEVSEHS